jgi:site-specific DNA recombinase
MQRFDDEGQSGATLGRNGLIELMLAAENGDIDQVVVHRVDRLSRKLSAFVHLLDFFSQHRVGISFVDGALATSGGALDRLQLSLLSTFAEFEHSMITERLRDAHAARRAQGLRSAGRLPFGYTSSPETKQLVPHPEQAAFVRSCFTRAAAGTLPAEIAADGKRRGGALARWSARAVTRMLRNPVYMGRHPDGAQSDHEPLVSADLFERAGEAIAGRRTPRATMRRLLKEDDPFVLRKTLKCARCRKAMIPAANVPMRALAAATPRYYRCRTLGCDGEPLSAADVEQRFSTFLAHLPPPFTDAQREEGVIRASLWAYLKPLNRRRSAELLFSPGTSPPGLSSPSPPTSTGRPSWAWRSRCAECLRS